MVIRYPETNTLPVDFTECKYLPVRVGASFTTASGNLSVLRYGVNLVDIPLLDFA